MSKQKNTAVPEAIQALNSFKEEIAKEFKPGDETRTEYLEGNMVKNTGDNMVKKMVEDAEKSLTHLGRS